MGVVYYANYFVWFEVGRTDLLRTLGGTYRELEAEGIFLPVIEAACEYAQPSRYDDELEIRTDGRCSRRSASSSATRWCGSAMARRVATGRTHARGDQPRGTAMPPARAGAARPVAGVARLIRSTRESTRHRHGRVHRLTSLAACCSITGAEVIGIDAFTDYYARSLKEANLATLPARPGFRFVERRLQDVDLGALLDGVTHVFHLAAQAGVRKSWGTRFPATTRSTTSRRRRCCSRRCVGRPIERLVYASTSSVYGDFAPIPMREDTRPQPVSPYGVTKLAAEHLCQLYFVNHGVPTVALRYFTVYGPRQRPDMGFHRFLTAAHRGEPITVYGDGEQTRDFTFVARRGRGDPARGPARRARARLQHRRRLARLGQRRPAHRRAGRRTSARAAPRAAAKGRHARHLRRHLAGAAPISGFDAGRARSRPASRQNTPGSARSSRPFPSHDMTMMLRSSIRRPRRAAGRRARAAVPSLASARRRRCARSNKIPEGTNEPDKFLFEQRQRGAREQEVAVGARVLPDADRHLPAEPASRRRQAGARRQLSRRRVARVAGARAQRVPRVPVVLSDAPARRLRAVQDGDVRTTTRWPRPGAIRPRRSEAIKEFDSFFERYPNSALAGRREEVLPRGARSARAVGVRHRAHLRTAFAGIRAPRTRFEELLKSDPQFTNRDGVYFYLAEALAKLNRQAEALPLLEKLVAEFQQSEYPGGRAEADRRS